MTAVSERLDAIEARKNAATEGPWEARDWGTFDADGAPMHCEVRIFANGMYVGTVPEGFDSNAEFIAHAPQDITDLLDLARKQQAALDALNGWCGRNKTGFYDEAQDDVGQIIRNALEGK